MPRSFPLRWKILSWFFVNLALIALGVFLLFRAQFRVGIDSLLNGPTGDRLEALARPLAAELRTLPKTQAASKRWVEAFERATAGWRERGLQAALVRNDGLLIAGEVPPLPPEIRQVLENFDRRKRASFGPRGPGPGMNPGGPGGGGEERERDGQRERERGDRDRPGGGGGWGGPRGFGPGGMGFERRGGGGPGGPGPNPDGSGGGDFWEAREIRPPNMGPGADRGNPQPGPPGNPGGPNGPGGEDGRGRRWPWPPSPDGFDPRAFPEMRQFPPQPADGGGTNPGNPDRQASTGGGGGGAGTGAGAGDARTAPNSQTSPNSNPGSQTGPVPTPQANDFRPQAAAGMAPERFNRNSPGGFPGNFSSGAPQSYGPLQKFMLAAGSPRTYWAGVHLDGAALTSPEPWPLPFTLLIASPSLRGGGLFFDYLPWLVLGGALLSGSVLLWLPFVHRLTKALGGLTTSAEAIARGQFDPPPVSGRRDELGRLQRAHRDMAARLEGFVTGQKRFLGDTAHELLSPIARLEVGLSILETRVGDEESRYIDRALGEVRQMSALVQDLLSFTKAGLRRPDVLPQSVVLADLAHEAVERETADCGPEVEVNVGIPGNLEVLALPSLLSRAIGNVVRNAVRYAAADGPILLSAEPRAAGADSGLGLGLGSGAADGEAGNAVAAVVLTIRDQGPGVPEDALPRLFDPFFRPDTSRAQSTGGTGLGLAIVKTAIEACGGTVTVRNGTPRGLVLEMVLKAAPPPAKPAHSVTGT
jgi:two-component system sensor histidine kinase CpxA